MWGFLDVVRKGNSGGSGNHSVSAHKADKGADQINMYDCVFFIYEVLPVFTHV